MGSSESKPDQQPPEPVVMTERYTNEVMEKTRIGGGGDSSTPSEVNQGGGAATVAREQEVVQKVEERARAFSEEVGVYKASLFNRCVTEREALLACFQNNQGNSRACIDAVKAFEKCS